MDRRTQREEVWRAEIHPQERAEVDQSLLRVCKLREESRSGDAETGGAQEPVHEPRGAWHRGVRGLRGEAVGIERLILFDNPISSNALKVRFLLSELGLGHERREVPLARPRPQWYLDVNPLGGIAAIQDGDLILSESNAILRYLANREGRIDLYPREPSARAADADAAAAPALYRTTHTGLDLSPFPNLLRWRDTLTSRPAFAHADPVR